MADLPQSAVARTAKLAALPLGYAGRTALGLGKRALGRPAELIATEVQARTAEQIFKVLGELKGGAMKIGQLLSVLESALPPAVIGPYRAALTKLQDSAPPMPATTVHRVLAEDFGQGWREHFASFDDEPAASASIGQVHRAVWADGRAVAVKVQYPGAAKALTSDLKQLGRIVKLFGVVLPGLDVRSFVQELQDRVVEELDYGWEAQAWHAFATEYNGDPDIAIPPVVAASEHVIVTEWLEGTPLSRVITDGPQELRDRAALLLVRFYFSGPTRARLLHADPHPGNFRMTADGRLGVLDFGAVKQYPDGHPPAVGPMLRYGAAGDIEQVAEVFRQEGVIREGVPVDLDALASFVRPYAEPISVPEFTFTRDWMRERGLYMFGDGTSIFRSLNVPPDYVMSFRVLTAGYGLLSQLQATAPFRAEASRWIPGFTGED
ncbi:ABC1 kinase family protein [Nonomuraea sediminis]|uniref:ABC1 kinase family protein n=1 Tax=Nonomuraea sediminis TaxID=2835864 RepID=UPI001BDD64D2|nr:AarF/ABC1/UbiB kinase family protein [Nonomuraea sediminis]